MYKLVNVRITEEEHQWLKAQRSKDVKFKQVDFLSDAITAGIKRAKRAAK